MTWDGVAYSFAPLATQTVLAGATSSVFGSAVVYTATVSTTAVGAGVPAGSIQFSVGGANSGTPAALVGGKATFTYTATAAGAVAVKATLVPAEGLAASSGTASHTVAVAPTTTTIAAAPDSVFGSEVVYVATVSTTASGAGVPAGTVQLSVGGTNAGDPVPLVDGEATFTHTASAAGAVEVTATYSGAASFAGSSGTTSHAVTVAPTTTTVSGAAGSVFGSAVSFTATVSTTAAGAGVPAGAVQFSVGGTVTGAPVALVAGKATYTHTASTAGEVEVKATYSGAASFAGSSGTTSHAVAVAPTATSVTSAAAGSVVGSSVQYTATVRTTPPGGVVPTGMVQFSTGGTVFGAPVALVGGKATIAIPSLAMGPMTVTATYLGSPSFGVSVGTTSQVVAAAATTTTLSAPATASVGSEVTIRMTVTSAGGVPTGRAELVVNHTSVQSMPLVDGVASFTLTDLRPGVVDLIALYTGDRDHRTSMAMAEILVAFPQATGTANERYIKHVYRDLFGRDPEPAGLAAWSTLLDNGTPRAAVANGITYSTEYRTTLITAIYARYLGRTPDPAGLAGWLGAMNGGTTVAQIESGFFGSSEYYAASGGTDAAVVGQMYEDILGRTAAPSEIAGWVDQLKKGASTRQVSMGFLLSTEHLTTVVDGYYMDLLGRHIDPVGQAGWVAILQAGGRDEAIIAGIVASQEYYSMP